jgi:16S rRNA (uracil1498-N3)-methyltransferase
MHRFFISSPDKILENEALIVSEDLVHQIRNVLRFKVGERVIFFDGSGFDFVVEFLEIGNGKVVGNVIGKKKNEAEPDIKISLYVAILKHQERFEFILQKGTEVGVSEFIPLITDRTEKPILHKLERLKRIIKEAAEQSGRGIIPGIKEQIKFCKIIDGLAKDEVNLVAHPESKKSISEVKNLLKKSSKINLFIGPEGGFSEKEMELAGASGFLDFNIGKRVLRAETAAIVIPAILLS